MNVSGCVPARDEEKNLGACLSAIATQTRFPLEVFVVNDGSTDKTGAIANEFAARDSRFRIIETAGVGPGAGRNVALSQAAGDIIAFTDADAIPRPDWLAELVAVFTSCHADVIGVGGAQAIPDDASPYERTVHEFLATFGFVSEYLRTDEHTVATRHIPTVNAAYRVSALRAVSGFREDLFPCEDLDRRLLARGGRLLFRPTAVVAHHRPTSPASFRRMMRSYGRGHARLVRVHGPYRLLHAMPFIVAASALGAVVAPFPARSLTLPSAAAAFLALTLKVGSPTTAVLFSKMLTVAVFEWHCGSVEGLRGDA
ncbi:MAG: glycosyltransferase [Deltaproteobacteria bacterium]|nr:glycosyltransferase [Deltaproteobacteria bacterium]